MIILVCVFVALVLIIVIAAAAGVEISHHQTRTMLWATAWIAASAPVAAQGFADAFGHRAFFISAGWGVLVGWLLGVALNRIEARWQAQHDDEYFRQQCGALRTIHGLELAKLEAERARREKLAMEVFRSHLTEGQRLCLDQRGYFFVRATSGAEYKVRREAIQNVELHQKDLFIQYCAVPKDGGHQWPLGDILLSQLLLLRHDEATFLAKAYKTVFDKSGTIAVQAERGDG